MDPRQSLLHIHLASTVKEVQWFSVLASLKNTYLVLACVEGGTAAWLLS